VPLPMKLQILNALILGMLVVAGTTLPSAEAQSVEQSVSQLESRVSNLESSRSSTQATIQSITSRLARAENRSSAASGGVAAFLFGAFCALWAQNTGRSAWAWFFLGLFFSVITVLVLLYKNSNDKRLRGQGA
jgi:outer membrane murein-binding lipoprotein Lpp